jgi:NADH:ubiquinone oxidoreductase subunit 4 (subunit M)
VFVGLLLWLAGRLGIEISDLLTVYVFYFGALIPLLFLIGTWLVARELLRSSTALLYVLIVAAFSPGVVLNLSDPGLLEFVAYCLFFVAAYLRFVGRPSRRSFAAVCLCAALVSLAVSQ